MSILFIYIYLLFVPIFLSLKMEIQIHHLMYSRQAVKEYHRFPLHMYRIKTETETFGNIKWNKSHIANNSPTFQMAHRRIRSQFDTGHTYTWQLTFVLGIDTWVKLLFKPKDLPSQLWCGHESLFHMWVICQLSHVTRWSVLLSRIVQQYEN